MLFFKLNFLSDFVRQQAESGFWRRKKKEKRLINLNNQLKIQTFSSSTTFGQDKKTNQLSDLKTKEKMLENIDLLTTKLKFYSLICDSFVLTENEEKI